VELERFSFVLLRRTGRMTMDVFNWWTQKGAVSFHRTE
jgi:hypothetical protein